MSKESFYSTYFVSSYGVLHKQYNFSFLILFVAAAVEAPGGVVLLPWALYFLGLPPLLGGLTC